MAHSCPSCLTYCISFMNTPPMHCGLVGIKMHLKIDKLIVDCSLAWVNNTLYCFLGNPTHFPCLLLFMPNCRHCCWIWQFIYFMTGHWLNCTLFLLLLFYQNVRVIGRRQKRDFKIACQAKVLRVSKNGLARQSKEWMSCNCFMQDPRKDMMWNNNLPSELLSGGDIVQES